ASGPTKSAPRRSTTRRRSLASRPAAAPTSRSISPGSRSVARRASSPPARSERSSPSRGTGGSSSARPIVTTTATSCTWRRTATLAVDRLVEREGRDAPCRTAELQLGMPASDEELTPPDGLDESRLPDGWRDQLAFRYGHAARAVLRLAADRPELADPIV